MLFSFKRIVLFCAMMAQFAIIAQQVEAIDKKGNIVTLNNNTITSALTAPSDPVENDVWLDTSDSENTRPKIWNGTAWLSLDYTGTPGSIFYAGSDNNPAQDNNNFFWNTATSRLGIGTNTPNARLDVEGGTIRFSDYGAGTITGTATNILAVESDGDVIEVDPSSLGSNDQKAYGELRLNSSYTIPSAGNGALPLATSSSINMNTTLNTSSHYIQIDVAGIYRVSYACSMRFGTLLDRSISVYVSLNSAGAANEIAHTMSSVGASNLNVEHNLARTMLLDLDANDRLYLSYTSYDGGNILLWGRETSLNVELID